MSESAHDELAMFQDALARLRPAPDGINIAQLLFQAGQRSAARRGWTWPCATAASMMLALTLGFVLLLRPVPQPAERIVTVYVQPPGPSLSETPVPPQEKADDALVPPLLPRFSPYTTRLSADSDYLQLRREVLAKGVEALPPPSPWSAAAPVDDSDTLLDMPSGSHDPWFLRLKQSLKPGDAL